MANTEIEIRAGDWFVVKQPAEIAASLDSAGTLDGLPFMPEMLEYCGRRVRVLRKAEKSCVEIPGGSYPIREFINNDVFLLDGLRCSGDDHDGCQRRCMFFWKSAWLTKATEIVSEEAPADRERASLRSRLKTKISPDRYFCQSTELVRSTVLTPIGAARILAKCIRDVASGAVSVSEMFWLVTVPLYRKLRDRLVGRPFLKGDLKQTPVGDLRLQPGEIVEIKSLEEMRQTLDSRGRNRGLVCDIELGKFSGTRYRVLSRLDQMVSESDGRMRKLQGTVILDGNMCMCARVLGGCPRLEFCYWREIWLKRVNVEPVTCSPPGPSEEQSVCLSRNN